ncbi:hypothetical protein Ccrd_021276, partial [Cynara cardunculus var. scolymus]
MLKELNLDGNSIISLPNCVRSLPRLEILSINDCDKLKTLEHPPRTLKELIFGFSDDNKEGKVVFDREMSPIMFSVGEGWGSFIEGMFKVEDMEDVEEKVLRSLGWSRLDFIQLTKSKVQMQYEFGIFSTYYDGNEIPNWISDRREGSSISFTIPSSSNDLRGLNFCFVSMPPESHGTYLWVDIKISNITKNRTWIYACSLVFESAIASGIYLSHWMFGKNEMEDGDQLTISIIKNHPVGSIITECGVSFVYNEDDDGKNKMDDDDEEEVLGYYKSWNHIIGGDLSAFRTTTPGEYFLNKLYFLGYNYGTDYVGMCYPCLLNIFR